MILYISLVMIIIGVLGTILRKNVVMAMLSIFITFTGVSGLILSTVIARNLEGYSYFPYIIFVMGFVLSMHGLLLVKNYFHEARDISFDKMKVRSE